MIFKLKALVGAVNAAIGSTLTGARGRAAEPVLVYPYYAVGEEVPRDVRNYACFTIQRLAH